MLAKELAEILLEHPEWEVTSSIDISTSEADSGVRAFGEDIHEVIEEPHCNQFTICFEGQLNFTPSQIIEMQKGEE
ncbi:hypothetical protein [Neptuniibacter sp. QD37_11]|uniref:hypothetical protein n=1 Tax=Neptuniibacter sp. QD37_11 TaxID=3398209 RepID=UPI0039F44B18